MSYCSLGQKPSVCRYFYKTNVSHLFPFSITSFRCSLTLVVAYTKQHDVLVWGKCQGDVIIMVPEVVDVEFPRDSLHKGRYQDTGGFVHPGTDLMIMFQVIYIKSTDMESHTTITVCPIVWRKQYIHIWLLLDTLPHWQVGKWIWIPKYIFCFHLCRGRYIVLGTSAVVCY